MLATELARSTPAASTPLAPARLLLASDVHLTPAEPEVMERFLAFLDGPAREADGLYLLGDLFEVWTHPSQLEDPDLVPTLDRLRALVSDGVDVAFLEGNRDFEAARALRTIGIRTLPQETAIRSGDRTVVLTHGDLLCTADVGYQALRRVLRSEFVRSGLRRLPASWLRRVGSSARDASKRSTERKQYESMALAPRAVAGLLRRHDADQLVCGHVHWGRRYRMEIQGRQRDLCVLGAWEDRPNYAELVDGELTLRWF